MALTNACAYYVGVIDATHIARATLDEIRTVSGTYACDDAATPSEKLDRLLSDAPVPNEAALATVLEETFWASLQRDEQRSSRFRLELLAEEEDPRQHVLHELLVPCELDRGQLSRLAQAVDADRGSIVWRDGDHGAQIVGFRAPRPEGSTPLALVVRSTEPGAIDIAWRGCWVVSYRRGELRRASECHLPGSSQLDALHVAVFGNAWPSMLQMAIRRILRRGHGGAIWIVPEARDALGLNVGFRLKKQPPLEDRYDDHEAWLASVADFSGTDGAVVVDSKLSVVGFGAFVDLLDACSVRRVHVDGELEVGHIGSVGGGRHRSAVSFCAKFSPAMAYVVSADGPVTMVSCTHTDPPEPIIAEVAPFDHLFTSCH